MKTVSSSYLLSFFETCIANGANEQALLSYIPGGKKAMQDILGRFPTDCIVKILAYTERTLNKPEIGLLAGQKFRPDTFTNIGHAIMFCRTLREVILINRRYQPITQQFGRSNLQIQGKQAWVYWDPGHSDPEYYRNVTDAVLSSHVQFGRWLTWVHDKKIDAMHFRHEKPSYFAMYEELFDCPVLFSQDHDVMLVEADVLDMPLPQANDDMLRDMCARLDETMLTFEQPASAHDRVEQHIRRVITQGAPSLSDTAHLLGLSDRSLRRKLQDEGTSFRMILENTRRSLCEQYMLEKVLSFAKISERLGYSEQSAFNRAFKLWYGQTPKLHARTLNIFDKAIDKLLL